MGMMGYGGWQYYGGASPAATGVQSFADNFMKAYSLFKGLNLKEKEEARQAELQGAALEKAQRENENAKKGQEWLEQNLRPKVIMPPAAAVDVNPSTQPQAPGMPNLTGTPADALMGPSIGQARFGLMPGQGPPQAPPMAPPQAGPLEANVQRPQVTPEMLTQYVTQFGTPEQKAALTGSLISARSKEATLENALEKQTMQNKSYYDVAMAKQQGMLDAINLKGGWGGFNKSNSGENKDNKLLATILQGQASNLQSEISNIERAIEGARPKDRAALQERRTALQEQLDGVRGSITNLAGEVKPGVAPKNKDKAPEKFDPESYLSAAKDAVSKGADKGAVKARLKKQGYTDKQLAEDPYFKGWL